MAVEFGCGDCGKLLSVPDDSAGKNARCPDCGSIQGIPDEQASVQRHVERDVSTYSPNDTAENIKSVARQPDPPETKPLSNDEATNAGENPFAAPAGNPFSEGDSPESDNPSSMQAVNPYQSPASGTGSVQSIFAGGNRD